MKILILDTEGRPCAYNIAFCVWDTRTQQVTTEQSYLLSDIFPDNATKQTRNKIARLKQDANTKQVSHDVLAIELKQIAEQCKYVFAANYAHDRNVLMHTFGKSLECDSWEWRDVLTYARVTFAGTLKFARWAIEHGYTTRHGTPKTDVQTLTRYLMDSTDYQQAHTALDDMRDETRIVLKSLRYKKRQNSSSNACLNRIKKNGCIANQMVLR